MAEPIADARGSEIPGNSANVTTIGLKATATIRPAQTVAATLALSA